MRNGWFLSFVIVLLSSFAVMCGNEENAGDSDRDTDTDSDTQTHSDSDSDTDSDSVSDSDTGEDTGYLDTDSTYDTDTDSSAVNKLALVVGISDYDGWDDLTYCDDDARDWYDYLTARDYEVKVLGDSRPYNFQVYHGLATKSNFHRFVKNLMASADSNDHLVITFSGHGVGSPNGSAQFLTHEGRYYTDVEFALGLETNMDIGHLFITLDSCGSGGFGPELLALTNSERGHHNMTCSVLGYGWDDPKIQNGAWTGAFLNMTLSGEFKGENVSMEDAFAHALSIYTHNGIDTPEMHDGDPKNLFYLSPYYNECSDDVESGAPGVHGSLGGNLLEFDTVRVAHTDWSESDPKTRTTSNRTITRGDEIERIIRLIRPSQKLLNGAPRCLLSHYVDFIDSTNGSTGRVGICQLPHPMANHPGVFVRLKNNVITGDRHGIYVSNVKALIDSIDSSF